MDALTIVVVVALCVACGTGGYLYRGRAIAVPALSPRPEVAAIVDELEREFFALERPTIWLVAQRVVDSLSKCCSRVEIVGSLRRGVANPGDADILFYPDGPATVMALEAVCDEGSLERVTHGYNATVAGVLVQCIRSTKDRWGMDMVRYTGSREFNKLWERAAVNRGWRIENNVVMELRRGTYADFYAPMFDNVSEEKILRVLNLAKYLDPRTRSLDSAVPNPDSHGTP